MRGPSHGIAGRIMQHIHGNHTLYHSRVGDDSREGELRGEEGHARRRREGEVVVPESVAIAVAAQLAREAHPAGMGTGP